MKIFIHGAGRCGRALGGALVAAGHSVVGSWNRTSAGAAQTAQLAVWPTFSGAEPTSISEADVVLVTVVDDAIAAASAVLPDHVVALHASGATMASALRDGGANPRSVAACHPLQSFAVDMAPPAHVVGITFGIQGEAEAVAVAQLLAADMGASSFVVEGEAEKALYHAACCVASNALVALADRAVTLFAGAGVSRAAALKALTPLILGTAENLAGAEEARDVLTGPIARGDEGVLARHRAAIGERLPDELAHYEALCEEIAVRLRRP